MQFFNTILFRFIVYLSRNTGTYLFVTSFAFSQPSKYPQHYFRNPLDISMELAANFGELRPNHWHMGLDIRTNQKVNLPVYAAADGYIARVSVEPGGFGQAIYINHPNGYTTLYAHLNSQQVFLLVVPFLILYRKMPINSYIFHYFFYLCFHSGQVPEFLLYHQLAALA